MGLTWMKTVIIILLKLSLTWAQFYECPAPWVGFQDKCYKFEMYPADVKTAQTNCEKDGSGLLSVNSRGEQDFLDNWFSTNDLQNREWYTSGRKDSSTEVNKYVWEGDGTEVQGYQFWLKDDAAAALKGNRIIYHTNGAAWGWKLRYGDAKRAYVCEISRSEVYKIVREERGFGYGSLSVDPSLWKQGPKFITQPVNTYYDKQGFRKYASLECVATGNPHPTYEWFQERAGVMVKINPSLDSRYTLTNGKLTIMGPNNTKDVGNYQCRASNKYGSILSNKVRFIFGYLLDFSTSRRVAVNATAHNGVGIECSPPSHNTQIQYMWYLNNFFNYIRTELKPYIFISRTGKLYFSSVTKDDEGNYYCYVYSLKASRTESEGKMSMPIPLKVNEAVASINEPKIVSGFPRTFPEKPKQGDYVRIECIAWGTAELQYSWRKLDGSIPGHAKLTDHNRVLNIPNIRLIHAGEYQCTVARRNGLQSQAKVNVTISAPPFFTIPLKDQHVDQGTDITWRCTADGEPSPLYQWYVNGTALDLTRLPAKDRERYTVTSNVLIVKSVQPQDSGMYQCAATNLHGVRYSSAQLRILSFAPSFIKKPVQPKVYATIQGNVTIMCSPEAAPMPTKEWKKNGGTLPVAKSSEDPYAHFQVLPNGNLFIYRVRKSDEGLYTCTATNDLGSASGHGRLSVLTTTSISNPPAQTKVEVNHTAFFHCEASYNPLLDLAYIWYHNKRKIEFYVIRNIGNKVYVKKDKHYSRGTGIYRGGLYISNAQFWHAGTYTCTAKTASDQISRAATLQVVGPPGPPAGVMGSAMTARTMRLRWMAGTKNGSPITAYVVEAYNMAEKFWRVVKANIRGKDLTETSTMVSNLTPYADYKFRVRAQNNLGLGEPSMESLPYKTFPAPPDKSPTEVGGGGGKVGDLTITWKRLAMADHNGPGLGYYVHWKKKTMTDKDWIIAKVTDWKMERFVATVGSPNFYTQYDVKVQAFNGVGNGSISVPITIWSAEDIPVAMPTNVRSRPWNSTALLVEWDPVPNTRANIKGILGGYRVNYWRKDTEDEMMAIHNLIAGQTGKGLIIGLQPRTYYQVNVMVYNSAGNGPPSEIFLEETLRAAPQEAPTEVHVRPGGGGSVEVTWRGVSTTSNEEPLQGYMVRYWRQGEDIYAAKDIDAEKTMKAYVTGLKENVLYNLRVLGYSRGGDGLMSSPAVQFVLGANCKVMEDSPDKVYLYSCRGCRGEISYSIIAILLILHQIWNHLL